MVQGIMNPLSVVNVRLSEPQCHNGVDTRSTVDACVSVDDKGS